MGARDDDCRRPDHRLRGHRRRSRPRSWARPGLRVVCLEQGGWIEPQDHPHYSPDWQWQRRSRWSADVNVRKGNADDFPVRSNSSQVLMWNGVGGSTNVYGALWPRYRPSDFRKGTEHGLQPGLADQLRGSEHLLRSR